MLISFWFFLVWHLFFQGIWREKQISTKPRAKSNVLKLTQWIMQQWEIQLFCVSSWLSFNDSIILSYYVLITLFILSMLIQLYCIIKYAKYILSYMESFLQRAQRLWNSFQKNIPKGTFNYIVNLSQICTDWRIHRWKLKQKCHFFLFTFPPQCSWQAEEEMITHC